MAPAFMQFAATDGPHISIAPEVLFHLGPLPVSNSMLLGLFGSLMVFLMLWATVRAFKKGSRSRLMHMILWVFEGLYDTTIEVIGDKKIARKVAPLAITIVFFFVINNWLGLLPIVGSITYNDAPLLRGLAADLNATLAIAVISIVTAQIWAMKRLGFFGNLRRYFINPLKDPLHSFVGILEFVAEFTRTAALALRIFGNVFGGEVLIGVIAFLTSYGAIVALPLFYVLELFVGAVQGYVFFMLTIAFISLGLPNPDAHGHEPEEDKSEARRLQPAKEQA